MARNYLGLLLCVLPLLLLLCPSVLAEKYTLVTVGYASSCDVIESIVLQTQQCDIDTFEETQCSDDSSSPNYLFSQNCQGDTAYDYTSYIGFVQFLNGQTDCTGEPQVIIALPADGVCRGGPVENSASEWSYAKCYANDTCSRYSCQDSSCRLDDCEYVTTWSTTCACSTDPAEAGLCYVVWPTNPPPTWQVWDYYSGDSCDSSTYEYTMGVYTVTLYCNENATCNPTDYGYFQTASCNSSVSLLQGQTYVPKGYILVVDYIGNCSESVEEFFYLFKENVCINWGDGEYSSYSRSGSNVTITSCSDSACSVDCTVSSYQNNTCTLYSDDGDGYLVAIAGTYEPSDTSTAASVSATSSSVPALALICVLLWKRL